MTMRTKWAGAAGRTLLAGLLAAALLPAAAMASPRTDASGDNAEHETAIQIINEIAAKSAARNAERTYVTEDGFKLYASSSSAEQQGIQTLSVLPEKYTAPYTSIKDQGKTGSCWSFASIAALESARLVQQGIASAGGNEVDWSEAHLVFGTFNGEREGNTLDGDELETSGNDHQSVQDPYYGFDTAGNSNMAAAALAAGRGLANESDAPFLTPDTDDEFADCAFAMAESAVGNYGLSRVRLDRSVMHPEVAPFLDFGDGTGSGVDRDLDVAAMGEIKQAIYEYGAITALYHSETDLFSPYYHEYVEPQAIVAEAGEGSEVDATSAETGDGAEGAEAGEGPEAEAASVSQADAASGTAANDIVLQLSPNYWVYDADVDVAGRGAVMVDHVIAIVGWDNTYSRWNFATPLIDDATGQNRAYDPEIAEVATGKDGEDYIVPTMDGAWVVKNSWGTEDSDSGVTVLQGDKGIFYLSYCEKTIAQPTTMVPDEAASDDLPYDETYQYDASTASTIFDDPFEILGANVFTATGSQSIDALGVWVTEYDTTLDIRVYTNLSDASDPESGTLVSSQREHVPSFGWYTVDLDQPASVSEGETFSVVASWNAPPSDGGSSYSYIPMENTDSNTVYLHGGESFFGTIVSPDQGDVEWVDCQLLADPVHSNVCIKAFATESEEEPGDPENPEGPEGSADAVPLGPNDANGEAGSPTSPLAKAGDPLPLATAGASAVLALGALVVARRRALR